MKILLFHCGKSKETAPALISTPLPSPGLGEKGISFLSSVPLFEKLVPFNIFSFLWKNLFPSIIFSLLCLSCFFYYGFFSLALFWFLTLPHPRVSVIPENSQLSSALPSLRKSPSPSLPSSSFFESHHSVFFFSSKKLFLPLNPASVFDGYYHSVLSHIIGIHQPG